MASGLLVYLASRSKFVALPMRIGSLVRPIAVRGLLITLSCVVAAAAQTVEPAMSADRPGFRNSTHLVGRGIVQIENGVALSSGSHVGMQSEFRAGVLRWLELRLLADEIVLRPGAGVSRTGVSDLQPGVKFPLFDRIPGTRIVAIVTCAVPSGHGSQTTGGYEPGAEIVWEHQRTDDFSFAGTWNLTRLKRERFLWQKAASVSMNNSFNDRVRGFVETFVVSPVELGGGNSWGVDAGLMRVIGRNAMIDAAAGHSVHGPSEWFVTVGLSFRTRTPRHPWFAHQ